jgi:hypothetical protein
MNKKDDTMDLITDVSNSNNINGDNTNYIPDSFQTEVTPKRLNNVFENIENYDKNQSSKRDKFREMLSNAETSILHPDHSLVVRKSSQFAPHIQGKGIKKSKTVHISNSLLPNKNLETPFKDHDYRNSDYVTTTVSEISSGYYPVNSKSSSLNDDKGNDIDSLTIRGYRTSRNKTPHVSFFLNQNSEHNSLFGNKMSEPKYQNSSNNSVSSQTLSRNSNSTSTKKVVSLHLQFTNTSNNAEFLPTNEKPISANFNAKTKSLSFRDDFMHSENRISSRVQQQQRPNDKFGLYVSSLNQHKPPTATSISYNNNNNNQLPMNSTSKFLYDVNDVQTNNNNNNNNNNEYSFTPSVNKNTNSSKYPIADNRFQDLLKIVKPPYLLTEIKDVNKIIEKNDALKASHLDIASREKMSKIKEKGYKLAARAKQAIDSGEYQI